MHNNSHFVSIPLDLNIIKTKFMAGLTKRQVICFAIGAVLSAPSFFLTKYLTNSITTAMTIMFIVASPAVVFGIFEKNSLFLNDYAKLMIIFFKKPKVRTYQSENAFKQIEREIEYENLVKKLSNTKEVGLLSNTKSTLTREERKKVEKRIAELKRLNKNNLSSTQKVIPYQAMYQNGLCHIQKNLFSLTIQFDDCNYKLVDLEDKTSIFSRWCEIHNYMDCKFQFTYENQAENIDDNINQINIPDNNDEYNDIRQEYNFSG